MRGGMKKHTGTHSTRAPLACFPFPTPSIRSHGPTHTLTARPWFTRPPPLSVQRRRRRRRLPAPVTPAATAAVVERHELQPVERRRRKRI